MKKFLILYYATPEALESMKNPTPEQKAAGMEPWKVWMQECGDAIVDIGGPLGPTTKHSKEEELPPEHRTLGYTIMQAESLEDLGEFMIKNPHFDWNEGATVEVSEIIPM